MRLWCGLVVLLVGIVGAGADVPTCDSCMCWLIMDDDSIDSANNMPDVTWWAENKFDSFFSSKGICDNGGKALECILNDGGDVSGDSLCQDVSSGGSGKIKDPDGGNCVSPPYEGYYSPYWMWNRATDSPGLCGDGVTARFPSGRGSPNSSPDTGIWRVLPTIASDGAAVVGYAESVDSCRLPDTVPTGYTVHQMSGGVRVSQSKSGGNSVKWDEVLYDEWVGAYLMGLIQKDCLSKKIRKIQPVTDIEVHDMKGRTCLAMVYDSDVNAGSLDLDLGDHGELLTSDLGNERLGVFKFTVVDHEVPGDGTGSNQCGGVGAGPDVGKGCGELNTNNVGKGDAEMYLLWWLQPECDNGNGGYVWDDDVSQITQDCNPGTCAASSPSIGVDQLSVDSKACSDFVAVGIQWGGGGSQKRCDPYVRVWVDGGDEGNDLNVPFAIDGYIIDCSDVCKPCFGPDKSNCEASDQLYETFGSGVCYADIPYSNANSIKDRFMMASSCGGGSQGGWEKFFVGSSSNGISGIGCTTPTILPPSPTSGPSGQCTVPTPSPTPTPLPVLDCPREACKGPDITDTFAPPTTVTYQACNITVTITLNPPAGNNHEFKIYSGSYFCPKELSAETYPNSCIECLGVGCPSAGIIFRSSVVGNVIDLTGSFLFTMGE